MTPGLHLNVSEELYHADKLADAPSMSRGTAVTLLTRSPLHAQLEHPRLNVIERDEPTAAMEFGSALHKMILGKGAGIEVGSWDDWRTGDAKTFRKASRACGKIPLLEKDYSRALQLQEAVTSEFARLNIADSFALGKSEVVALWQEDGFWLRAMYDRLVMNPDSAIVYDLKITENAHPDTCTKQLSNMSYDLQSEHYLRGLEKLHPELAGRTRFIFLFIENSAPFSVTPIELNGEWKKLAQMQWERGFALWKKCLTSNTWPAYTDRIVRAEPPAWKMASELKKEYENA